MTRRRVAWASASARQTVSAVTGVLVAMAVLAAGCTSAATAPSQPTGAPAATSIGSPTGSHSGATTVVGTSTVTSTRTVITSTRTVPGTVTTVTAPPSGPAAVAPPPATKEPAPAPGTCPYLTNQEVMDDNGQHTGQTSLIATKPYPVCVFTRSDGGYLATTRIVVAATPAQAAAAVNQHVPVDRSSPAALPNGWTGGAMGNLKGVPGYPGAASIYAVSKGKIAIIALSNQKQSVKGRQMVTQIVANLHL